MNSIPNTSVKKRLNLDKLLNINYRKLSHHLSLLNIFYYLSAIDSIKCEKINYTLM